MAPNATKKGRTPASGVQRHHQQKKRPALSKNAPPPPPYVPRGEPQITRHLLELVDASTKGTVHDGSTLVALYNYPQDQSGRATDNHYVNRELLRNLTDVAEPAMLCRLILDGQVYPPRDSRDGYVMYITFSNLVSIWSRSLN